ncbi:MAG: hypothetical protein H6894_04010 [Defluviimonas sp.]|nr:hypothetical protein [Defluviimonas sp.]
MSYDGENRPLTVTYAGKTTAYVYGDDGARLKKIETDPITGAQDVTLYAGPLEIRHRGQE